MIAMKQDSQDVDALDRLFLALAGPDTASPMIVCLHTGGLPAQCAPMPRDPAPATGQLLDRGFAGLLAEALTLNPSVHDGAVMAGRPAPGAFYRITGWSYRLLPPDGPAADVVNRGSAFHSSLAMSAAPGVDRLYLATRGALVRFEGGRWTSLR